MAYKKSPAELKQDFIEQLELLKLDCLAYDNGSEASGKRIALALRLLLNNVPANKTKTAKASPSLMDLLGLRTGWFLSSAPKLSKKNLLSDSPLLVMHVTDSGVTYLPLVAVGGGPLEMSRLRFSDWWLQPIIKDNKGVVFSRMGLVSLVANKDGGAHVDQEVPTDYGSLTRGNSLGWEFQFGDTHTAPNGRPELACMRQIAHELLCSIEHFMPEFAKYVSPTSPLHAVNPG